MGYEGFGCPFRGMGGPPGGAAGLFYNEDWPDGAIAEG